MGSEDQDWVSLTRAANEVAVPVTTIRDWLRSGVIESTTTRDGQRLVRMSQAIEHATGLSSHRGRALSRPARTPEQLEAESAAIAERNRAVVELQGMARDRTEDPPD